MNYKVIDKEKYYRKGVFRHFSEDCKCSTSMTARIDVTELAEYSKKTGTKFYINFLYLLSKALNSREDYRMGYLWQTDEIVCYDVVNPTQYIFHDDTETFTLAYTNYSENYEEFYKNALKDAENAKKTREYGLDAANHPNWFDASFISWLSYDSLNIELPDGYLFFAPIVNWGKYREENGRLMMPVSVRMNHAIADGFLLANVFRLLQKEIGKFVMNRKTFIRTKRLEIELMTEEDVKKLLADTTDEGLIKAYSEMLAGAVNEPSNAVWYLPWSMRLAEDKTYIGNIGFHGPEENKAVEIGYGVEPVFEGQGYATEAAEAMVSWAFEQSGIEFVEAEAEETNLASLRIIEKLGFQKCGMGEEGPRFVKKKP